MIERLTVADIFSENAYFYIDPQTSSGFLIDPGAEAQRLLRHIKEKNWDIKAILLTHGHFDHTGAIATISGTLNIPYYISRPGYEYLINPQLNLSANFGRDSILPDAKFFNEGDFISLPDNGDFGLEIISTPGHTPDSSTLYAPAENAAFVGDAIFLGQPGTAQFPGGNERELMASIKEKILRLPPNTVLYSGHTPPTSVEREIPNYFY